jgi:hypothetical protein
VAGWYLGGGREIHTQLIFQIDFHGAFVDLAGDEIATEGRKSRCGDMVGDVEDRNDAWKARHLTVSRCAVWSRGET